MFLLTISVMCLVNIGPIYATDYHMDTIYDRIDISGPSSLFSSGTLSSQFFSSGYTTNRNKTLILVAPSGCGMQAAIQLLDLRPNNQDTLILFDNKQRTILLRYTNSWSTSNTETFPYENYYTLYAPSGELGITFTTGSGSATWYKGFKLTYTAQGTRSFDCGLLTYRCDNGRCIYDSLRCNSHNNCGDRSDETNCMIPTYFPTYVPTYISNYTGRNLGIGFGVLFLVIAIVCGIFIVVRRANVTRTEVRTVHPPPGPGTYYPSPPPPYSTNQGMQNPAYR